MTENASITQGSFVQDEGGHIHVTYRVCQEGDQYVAECPDLGLASCGDTIGEAFEMIADASSTYLNTLESLGQQARVFAQRGISIYYSGDSEHNDRVDVDAGMAEYVSRQSLRIPAHLAS